MKALTIRQPWATLIATGVKRLEVRKRQTLHRGPLLVCAGAAIDDTPPAAAALVAHLNSGRDVNLPRRQAIAVVNIVDCRPMVEADAELACYPFDPTRFVYVLRDAMPIEPFTVRGTLGMFDFDAGDLLRRIAYPAFVPAGPITAALFD
jgi:hypothetical protein